MTSVRPTFFDHDFRAVMGHFCTGVAIVTGCNHGQAAGFVAQSVQSISLNPPLVSISPAGTSTSWPTIRSSGYFALNFLTAEQRPLCHRFAQSSIDKFDGVGWSSSLCGSPILDGVLGFVSCRIEVEHEAGDHTIVIGRVLDLGVSLPDAKPLLFFRGRYGSFLENSA